MRRLLLFLLCCAAPSHACLWDSDTLSTEAKGLPDVVQIITGRFERNPPLYYEMRMARVSQEIKAQPTKLELYDDAGVACDRLHKSDEAIAWMKQKRAQLKPFPQDKEHWYRYHANLGTFQAHRWLRSGADRKKISELKTARDNIKRAIQINPDAHFGREKYQLMAMEWIINPPQWEAVENKTIVRLPSFLGSSGAMELGAEEAKHIAKGLGGLIVLGDAWQSVDVFYALAISQGGTNSSVGYLAWMRCRELVRNGSKSLLPSVPRGDALKEFFKSSNNSSQYTNLTSVNAAPVESAYATLRSESREFQKRRLAYMMERLNAGQHPDTDNDFWKAWRDSGPPSVWFYKSPLQWTSEIFRWLPWAILALVLWFSIRRVRRRLSAV